MHLFVARLRDSERFWSAALFCGLCLVLVSGSPVGVRPAALAAQGETAALAALLAIWVARASGSRRSGLAIALAAVFTTPLLPYAFAELETTQSLLLFAAAFLAIGPTKLRFPARDSAFLLAAAGVLVTKGGGLFLLPLLLWLAWCGAERSGAERRAHPRPAFTAALATLLALAVASALVYQRFPVTFRLEERAAWRSAVSATLVDSPVDWLVNIHGFLLSLNKGLLLFAPLALFGLWRAFRGAVDDRRVGHFALFAASSLILPYAALTTWSDSTWGPRHLLAALAPALLALALSRTERARRGGHRRWIIAAVGLGIAVNSLGTAVPQEALARLTPLAQMTQEGRSVALQFDPRFNQPRVNAVLLGDWLRAAHLKASATPATAAVAGSADADAVVHPAPVLLLMFDAAERPELLPVACLLLLAGAAGWALLVLARHAAES